NERADLLINWWTAIMSAVRASRPAAAQPVAMPADDGVRLHDNQRSAPVPPKSREGHPEESVARLEAASRRSVVRRQLLPQREVFQDQFPVAAKHQRDCADDDDKQLRHAGSWLELARNSIRTSFGEGQPSPSRRGVRQRSRNWASSVKDVEPLIIARRSSPKAYHRLAVPSSEAVTTR